MNLVGELLGDGEQKQMIKLEYLCKLLETSSTKVMQMAYTQIEPTCS